MVADSLCSDDLTCDAGSHDEPYIILTGFSIYPEGVSTWRAGEYKYGSFGHGCRDIGSVVFEGEINPYYIIGFTASLYEDDGSGITDTQLKNRGKDMAEKLGRKLRGEEEVGGECGENIIRRTLNVEVGEDCSGGGVYRFPVYNVGEPDHLLITDLSGYGFRGEDVSGIWCGDNFRFCGGLGYVETDPTPSTSILEWMKIPGRDSWRPEFIVNDEVKFKGKGMPEKLSDRLGRP
jgi:hypothetical protein